jgi:hypothetical protein
MTPEEFLEKEFPIFRQELKDAGFLSDVEDVMDIFKSQIQGTYKSNNK